MVVMDPLALPLSCPCVQGYAQRNYDKLGAKLQKDLGRPVKVVYSESLTKALKEDAHGRADVVIGKHSVVQFDASRADLKITPIARLSGKDGMTMQTGLIVVPKDDPAKTVSDLAGYRIVFGPEECDEKHSAAITLLKNNGVKLPEKLETSPACSDGACNILDEFKKDSTSRGAALISSYAKPLLEGCGTVEKGALRVVGETKPVPFVEAFITEQVKPAERAGIAAALMKSTNDPLLRLALETRDGFVAIKTDEQAAVGDNSAKKK
jgi:ABC-type phosphate/phosphonate transport system substrate-binding protein